MLRLGVNIDHVATIRQARGGKEPDPVWAAVLAELGGADGITIHLREDRRHIQDHDVVFPGECLLQPVASFVDQIHVEAFLNQVLADQFAQFAVIVDN